MRRSKPPRRSDNYRHPEAEALLRPDIGIQPQFRKKKPAAAYRYDSSLAPALEWGRAEPGTGAGRGEDRRVGEADRVRVGRPRLCRGRAIVGGGSQLGTT